MSKFNINMPDDMFDSAIEAMSPENLREAIDKASPILKASMKKELKAAIRHSGESEAVSSLTASRAKKAKNGAYISRVYPKGKTLNRPDGRNRSKPVSNAMKAAILNYGKKGQPARPWLQKGVNNARAAVEESLERSLEGRIG